MLSPTYEIATDLMSYGRVSKSRAWDGCIIAASYGWEDKSYVSDTRQQRIEYEAIDSNKPNNNEPPCHTALATRQRSERIHKNHVRTIGHHDVPIANLYLTVVRQFRFCKLAGSTSNWISKVEIWISKPLGRSQFQPLVLLFDEEYHYRRNTRSYWHIFRISLQHSRGHRAV